MQISTRVRYGMRAMIELAMEQNNLPLRIPVIAENQDISLKYLEQLMIILKNAGLVKSVRGKAGGYILARDPENITAAEIFSALDGNFTIIPCVNEPCHCERREICKTQGLWQKIDSSLKKTLGEITLRSLAE